MGAGQSRAAFHAAPAGDYVRVELETELQRNYDRVLHHDAKEVIENAGPHERVRYSTELRPGTWRHDEERNDLHILIRGEAGSDHIVNIMF